MRKLLYVIIAAVIAIAVFATINWHRFYHPSPTPSPESTSALEETDATDEEESDEFYIDTIMYAGGHAFGYGGDISEWGGWYFDTIHVSDDRMLRCDSVGPSSLRLNLVTRQLIVNLKSPDALDKIKNFLNPIDGFRRFQRKYEVCLDSVEDKEYGTFKCMGYFSFSTDYADPSHKNVDKLNRFICDLTDVSNNESVDIPEYSAIYAGYDPTEYYSPIYTGAADDMPSLSDFLADRTFENWRRSGDLIDMGSMASDLEVRANTITPKYVTFSMYDYEREGIAHGMYTETFHTYDFSSGKILKNKDIFKPHTLDKVASLLFEVMAKDAYYAKWNEGLKSGADVKSRIASWQSPLLEVAEEPESAESEKTKSGKTESERAEDGETESTSFTLPEGALTEKGVIFSFQPYEIDCFAAGAFHFTVPYSQLTPYLTPKAKRLLSK